MPQNYRMRTGTLVRQESHRKARALRLLMGTYVTPCHRWVGAPIVMAQVLAISPKSVEQDVDCIQSGEADPIPVRISR